MSAVKHFIKSEAVLLVSMVLALITLFLVPPDADYLSYIDLRTLSILFCLMVIMAGLQELNVFRRIGEGLVGRVSSLRGLTAVLVLLCFFFSMLITNDVALLTFVPFTVSLLAMTGRNDRLIPVIVLETAAANLGSMMTPVGNPQNLYLYSLTDLSLAEFVLLILPYGAVSLFLLLLAGHMLSPKEYVSLRLHGEYTLNVREKGQLTVWLLLFAVSLLVVARVLDWRVGFAIVLIITLISAPKTLLRADYSLIFTFVFLFIFIGNMKRIPSVSDLLSSVIAGRELLTSVLASQVISNVPAAILLSGFTENIRALIVGTNLGGLGTLIASMASLISFRQYVRTEKPETGRYVLFFTAINVGLLAVLGILAFLIA